MIWDRLPVPEDYRPVSDAVWVREIEGVYHCDGLWAFRHIRPNGTQHLVVSREGGKPDFCDFQEVKNHFGWPEGVGVQIMPPQSRLFDSCDLYHIFIPRQIGALREFIL
jgi:hypothetical protein